MAKLVKGHSYAYQVLGYLCYKKQKPYNLILDEFDAYLAEYVYDKIWNESSKQDQSILEAITISKEGKIKDIRNIVKISSSKLSVYRDRLLKKGLVINDTYSYLSFTLPRFSEYINFKRL